ncbi:hypothetical protein [Providencia phage Kokobel2]|nr:hypothetical protein [Providencia phage Kokobel2]
MKNLPKATVIVDAQFGSTGKGLIAGFLAMRDKPDTVMTAWSANAGHTYIDRHGRTFVHCMLANGVVSPNLKTVLIGAGSQMNFYQLIDEILSCKDLLGGKKVYIHQSAAIITDKHVEEEAGPMTKIGSTKKGCGAAMIQKIRRNPDNMNTAGAMADLLTEYAAEKLAGCDIDFRIVNHSQYMNEVYAAERIQVEGAQGFSIGINSGFYPYVTSRECTPQQVCVDVGLPLQFIDNIVATMRTFPIRVANRYNDKGEMVGTSGPCYSDQIELNWEEDLGMKPELTTVTKLPRRIFSFSRVQTREALRMIRPNEVFLNFCNYPDSDYLDTIRGIIEEEAEALGLSKTEDTNGQLIAYEGYGPAVQNVVDMFNIEKQLSN